MKRTLSLLVAVSGFACTCLGQVEANGGQLRFEVLNPSTGTWGSEYNDAMSGQQIEWRVVASYIGTRTDLFAMGEVLYQPTISNVDNLGSGAQADQIAPWRNGGAGGNSVPSSMLTAADGNIVGPLPGGYGRVGFGGTVTAATWSNLMTSFRHSGGSDSAPAGEWIRIAGNFVTQWPQAYVNVAPDAAAVNRILRGISSMQQSQALAPTFHIPGTQNLVLFRQAIILSDSPEVRELQISTFQQALRRVGGTTSTDDTRYMSWQTGSVDSGSYRTGVVIVPAIIRVNIPSPGGACVLGAGAVWVVRRRRSIRGRGALSMSR